MEELSFKRIILKTQNGLFVSAKPQGSYNMIFLTPEIGNAIIWNIRKGKICDESCQLFWDVWDETNPRLTMYRDGGGNNYNQLWNIYSHENDDEIIIYSRNENVHNRGINYSESKKAILFEREPRPFRIVPLEKAVSTLQPTGIISKTETKEIDNALKLRSTYYDGYAFPAWSIDFLLKYYNHLAPSCRVYYSEGSLNDAKQLTLQREPVNIAMKRYYDKDLLKQYFGWSTGFYGEYYDKSNHKQLAPNIAVYCPTFVKLGKENYKQVHMLNSIGYAFDSKYQPDFQLLSQDDKVDALRDRYRTVFEKIFHCARDIGCDTVVMSMVGAGVFSTYYTDFRRRVWDPVFRSISRKYYNEGIKTVFMGPEDLELSNLFPNPVNIGLFPQNVNKVDTKKTLFVNSWDSWSIAGNGNEKDNSLDGYVGRYSMVAVLTWPLTNHYLLDSSRFKYIK